MLYNFFFFNFIYNNTVYFDKTINYLPIIVIAFTNHLLLLDYLLYFYDNLLDFPSCFLNFIITKYFIHVHQSTFIIIATIIVLESLLSELLYSHFTKYYYY